MPIQREDDTEAGNNNFSVGEDRRTVNELSTRWEDQQKPYKDAAANYHMATNLIQQGTGIGDQQLIRKLVKVAEGPGSRVSNEDAAAFARSMNLGQATLGAILKAGNQGESFPPAIRAQIKAGLEKQFELAKQGRDSVNDEATRIAVLRGVDPAKFIRNLDPMVKVRKMSDILADFNTENAKPAGQKDLSKLQQLLAEIENNGGK